MPGSAQGLRTLRVTDRRPAREVIDVQIVVKKRTFAAPAEPLAVKVVLDAGEEGVTAPCGSIWFPAAACRVRGGGRTYLCR